MTLRPLADRVVVKAMEAEEKTKSGLILAAASQEKPQIATRTNGVMIWALSQQGARRNCSIREDAY